MSKRLTEQEIDKTPTSSMGGGGVRLAEEDIDPTPGSVSGLSPTPSMSPPPTPTAGASPRETLIPPPGAPPPTPKAYDFSKHGMFSNMNQIKGLNAEAEARIKEQNAPALGRAKLAEEEPLINLKEVEVPKRITDWLTSLGVEPEVAAAIGAKSPQLLQPTPQRQMTGPELIAIGITKTKGAPNGKEIDISKDPNSVYDVYGRKIDGQLTHILPGVAATRTGPTTMDASGNFNQSQLGKFTGTPVTSNPTLPPSQYAPLERTSEQLGVDPQGNTVAITTKSTSKRVAPVTGGTGTTTTASPASPAAPSGSTAQLRTSTQPTPNPSTKIAAPTTPSQTAPGIRLIPGAFKDAEADKQQVNARAIREAGIQLHGDPKDPSFVPLDDYADLADDPAARVRVGGAVKLVMSDLLARDPNLVDHLPFLGTSGLLAMASNYSGLPSAVTRSEAAELSSALGGLTDRERAYMDRLFASMSSFPAARKLTSQGAYQFAYEALKRDLPVIGLNTYDRKEFYRKLASDEQTLINGMPGISDSMLPEKSFIKGKATDYSDFATGLRMAPPPKITTDGYGPTENRTLTSGEKVRVRKNLKTGKYEETK